MIETIYFFDIVNITLALALIAAVQYRFQLPWWITTLFLFHFALIFLTNGVLFPPSYMPDQFKYLQIAQSIRGVGERIPSDVFRLSVDSAGIFFGLFPIPLINSIYSISIINFILYLVVFLFLYNKGMLKGLSLWVMLLFPSLLLYTSVSLRDTLIFMFMAFGIWLYAKNRVILSLIVQLPLAVLKAQNLGIFALSLVFFILLAIFRPKISRRRIPPIAAIAFLAVLVAFIPFAYRYGLRLLNLYRNLFWLEDVGLARARLVNPATQINSVGKLISLTLINIPYFLVKPLPWEADSMLQLLQSFENLVVAGAIVYLVARAVYNRAQTPVMTFMLVYLIVSLAVYGLTVWNFGTAVRYKFPFVTLFLVFYSRGYTLQKERSPQPELEGLLERHA